MRNRRSTLAFSALALAAFSFTATAADHSFSNTATIGIADNSPASVYPSEVSASGLGGDITAVSVTLHGISHSWVGDLNLLLVAPNGQAVALLRRLGRNDLGFGHSDNFSNAEITFSATAAATVPATGVTSNVIPDGSYLPSGIDNTSSFAPAPAGPYASDLTAFNGPAAGRNGGWRLYLSDHAPGDFGSVAGGWTLHISTTAGPEPETTCASEGYTGTKLKWCQNICESELSAAQIETWIHRWINRYRTLPACALEGEEGPM